jgi:hypothetical protein
MTADGLYPVRIHLPSLSSPLSTGPTAAFEETIVHGEILTLVDLVKIRGEVFEAWSNSITRKQR